MLAELETCRMTDRAEVVGTLVVGVGVGVGLELELELELVVELVAELVAELVVDRRSRRLDVTAPEKGGMAETRVFVEDCRHCSRIERLGIPTEGSIAEAGSAVRVQDFVPDMAKTGCGGERRCRYRSSQRPQGHSKGLKEWKGRYQKTLAARPDAKGRSRPSSADYMCSRVAPPASDRNTVPRSTAWHAGRAGYLGRGFRPPDS